LIQLIGFHVIKRFIPLKIATRVLLYSNTKYLGFIMYIGGCKWSPYQQNRHKSRFV
jgi:hypothetical protein